MAKLSEKDFKDFENYSHTYMIKITDLQEGNNFEFIGEYLSSGKRYDNNQPGVTGQTLDQTYDGSEHIFHYFCNAYLTGVSGGMMYRYNDVYLYIGFSNPLVGCTKSSVELKETAETARWAYEQNTGEQYKMDTCCRWKVEARFRSTERRELKVTIGKDVGF